MSPTLAADKSCIYPYRPLAASRGKGYWPLGESAARTALDYSGNANHGTVTGTIASTDPLPLVRAASSVLYVRAPVPVPQPFRSARPAGAASIAASTVTPDPAIGGGDADDVPFSAPDVSSLRRELGRLEDQAAAAGWGWNAGLSLRVDALCVRIEDGRA